MIDSSVIIQLVSHVVSGIDINMEICGRTMPTKDILQKYAPTRGRGVREKSKENTPIPLPNKQMENICKREWEKSDSISQ